MNWRGGASPLHWPAGLDPLLAIAAVTGDVLMLSCSEGP